MISAFLGRILEGFRSPRGSVRRVIDGGHGLDIAIAMVVFSYLAGSIVAILVPGGRPGDIGLPIVLHTVGIAVQIGSFFVLSLAAFGIGKLFGGKGTLDQAYLTIGWHTLVTTVLAPLFVYAVSQVTPERVPLGAIAIMLFAVSL